MPCVCVCVCVVLQDFEMRELEWEHREVELERIVYSMEQQQAAIAGAASQVNILTVHLLYKYQCTLYISGVMFTILLLLALLKMYNHQHFCLHVVF